jgi:hypothetical protein
MHALACLASLLALSPPPAPAATAPLPVRFESASEVKDAQALQSAIDKPFDEPWKVKVGPKGPERSLTNCAQLAVDFPAGMLETPDPINQRPLLFQRAHCRALLWLKDAKPSRRSFLGGLVLSLETAGSLPDVLIPNLGVPKKKARASGARTWKAADAKLALNPTPPPQPGFYLRGRDYEAEVSIYGRGDFDGDGLEDVLIRRDGYPRKGSYQEFGLFLLTRTAEGAPFKVLRSASEGY